MSSNKRSVQFSESTKPPAAKRSRHGHDDDDGQDDRKPAASNIKKPKYSKREDNRPNEDELDDVDDWNKQEDGDDPSHNNNMDIGDGLVPSESELLEAKRQRRQKRGNALGGDTHIDTETSLATEGVKIEPFHMRDEENDGSGYFDGDTYVFRSRAADDDGEPDAWADSLRDEDGNPTMELAQVPINDASRKKESSQEDLDDLTKEQLYERILPLVSDSETVAKAIRRYGQLVKQQQKEKKARLKAGKGDSSSDNLDEDHNMAKSCLDDLTGASNALLLQGEVDIYDTTRDAILRMFPNRKEATNAFPKNVKWEYQGDQDKQMHGPFTTEQMLGWVKAGYFVGAQRVKIRYIQELSQDDDDKKEPPKPELSTEDDLLADLMDDDDMEDAAPPPLKKAKTTSTVKGAWMWSSEVDYQKYL